MDDCKLEVADETAADEEGPADKVVGDVPDKAVRSFVLEHVEFDDDVDADNVDVEDEIDGDELS